MQLRFFVFSILLFPLLALGQTAPDAGSLLREQERGFPLLPKLEPKSLPRISVQSDENSPKITVNSFKVTGNTLVGDSELQAALAPWVGREVSYTELQEALNAVAEIYRTHGWFARPILPVQDVTEGEVLIHIIEAKVGEVRIDSQGKELKTDIALLRNMVMARQQSGGPLDIDAIDRSTALLNDIPGLVVTTFLMSGQRDGESDIEVKVKESPLFTAYVQGDTQGARSTGKNRLSLNGTLNNPLGIGDQVTVNTNASLGSEYAKLGYSLPVGSDGFRVGVAVSLMQYHLVGDFASMKANGNVQTYSVNALYPVLRSSMRNLSSGFLYERKDYYNEANALTTSKKKIDTVSAALAGDFFDGVLGGGGTQYALHLTGGYLDLSADANNEQADRNGPKTAGGYSKLSYSLSRLQRLFANTTLLFSINGQIAGKNLDSSEKISLGGASGVRAYPALEGTGDDGWVAATEIRYNLFPELQLIGFYDHGRITQSHAPQYPGSPLVNNGALKGGGLGFSWNQAGNFVLRTSWSHRIGSNPFANPLNGKDQDGSLDKNRIWITAIKIF